MNKNLIENLKNKFTDHKLETISNTQQQEIFNIF